MQKIALADIKSGKVAAPWDWPVDAVKLDAGGLETTKIALVRRNVFDPHLDAHQDKIVGYATDEYSPVSYKDLIDPVFEMLDEVDNIQIGYTERDFGSEVHFRVTFGDDIDFGEYIQPGRHVAPERDILRRSIDVTSSHNTTYGVRACGLFERLACFNGLIIPMAVGKFSMRHLGWDPVAYADRVAKMVRQVTGHYDDAIKTMHSWKDALFTATELEAVLDQLAELKYPSPFINQVAPALIRLQAGHKRNGTDLTAWDTYNALTDHRVAPTLADIFKQEPLNAKSFDLIKEIAG